VEKEWDSIIAILSHVSMRLDEEYRKCFKNNKKKTKKEIYCLC